MRKTILAVFIIGFMLASVFGAIAQAIPYNGPDVTGSISFTINGGSTTGPNHYVTATLIGGDYETRVNWNQGEGCYYKELKYFDELPGLYEFQAIVHLLGDIYLYSDTYTVDVDESNWNETLGPYNLRTDHIHSASYQISSIQAIQSSSISRALATHAIASETLILQ